jgi:L-fuconolactonase
LTVARDMPQLTVVLNHLSNPPVPAKGWEPWATFIKRAAAQPNTSVKQSAGLALVVRWEWSTADIRRYVDHVLRSGPSE